MSPGTIFLAGGISAAERGAFHDRFGAAIADDPVKTVRYAVVWKQPEGLLATLPNLEVIFSLGAGVDHVLRDPTVPDVPLVRFVDPDLTGRMVEWVTLQCLLHLRRQRVFDNLQRERRWEQLPMPRAREVTVGIMGLGTLGLACAKILMKMDFLVRGLTRHHRTVDGVKMFTGENEDAFLAGTDILVNLLPLTDETRGLIDSKLIDRLKPNGALGGPIIINAGRGGSQVETDIVAALDDGRLAGVSLDVFETEPLAPESPLWGYDSAILTPHVAATTDPDALVAHVVEQIDRHENGRGLQHLVDRNRGY